MDRDVGGAVPYLCLDVLPNKFLIAAAFFYVNHKIFS